MAPAALYENKPQHFIVPHYVTLTLQRTTSRPSTKLSKNFSMNRRRRATTAPEPNPHPLLLLLLLLLLRAKPPPTLLTNINPHNTSSAPFKCKWTNPPTPPTQSPPRNLACLATLRPPPPSIKFNFHARPEPAPTCGRQQGASRAASCPPFPSTSRLICSLLFPQLG